jgi:hypothetical protein
LVGGNNEKLADSESCVSIQLGNLPQKLCSEKFLGVVLEQAGLEGDIVAYGVNLVEGSKHGEGVVVLTSEAAAQHCIRHFQGLKFAGAQKQITTRYCAAAGRRLMEIKKGQQKQQPQCDDVQPEDKRTVLKLQKTLREIKTLKLRPVEELDVLQKRKVEREAAVIAELQELGVHAISEEQPAEVTEQETLGKKTSASPPIALPLRRIKKAWADYDIDDDVCGNVADL